jgi:spore coat protein U-like protein
MRKVLLGVGAVAALAGSSTATLAATATGTFNVTLTITDDCTVSATALNFGSSGLLTANINQTSTITVRCSNSTAYNVGLDAGINGGGTVSTRGMQIGGQTVNYTLYSDAGRTTNWGDTVGVDTVSGTGTGANQTVTIYGRVPPQATPTAGAYTDTITVTVTY